MTALSPADYLLVEDILRESVEAHIGEEDNLDAVRETFTKLTAAAFHNGSIIVEVERLITADAWAWANNRAAHATKKLLAEVVAGQTTIDPDAWLDQVITVGNGRRSTVRHLNQSDLDRIVDARAANVAKATQALLTAQQGAQILGGAIASCGDVATALESGELYVEFGGHVEGVA